MLNSHPLLIHPSTHARLLSIWSEHQCWRSGYRHTMSHPADFSEWMLYGQAFVLNMMSAPHCTAHMCSHLSLQHATTQQNKCRPQNQRPHEIKELCGFKSASFSVNDIYATVLLNTDTIFLFFYFNVQFFSSGKKNKGKKIKTHPALRGVYKSLSNQMPSRLRMSHPLIPLDPLYSVY